MRLGGRMTKNSRLWRDIKVILMLAPPALWVVPGIILGLLGLGLMGTQLLAPANGPLVLGRLRMDFHWSILGSFFALVGYQLLIFHFLTRVYLVSRAQEREDRLLAVGLRVFTLERAMRVASIVIITGLVLDGVVAIKWLVSGFGPLVQGNTRLFILGSTLLVLGIQTALNAFFFSALRDAWRLTQAPA
jgi:hypothetical protein